MRAEVTAGAEVTATPTVFGSVRERRPALRWTVRGVEVASEGMAPGDASSPVATRPRTPRHARVARGALLVTDGASEHEEALPT